MNDRPGCGYEWTTVLWCILIRWTWLKWSLNPYFRRVKIGSSIEWFVALQKSGFNENRTKGSKVPPADSDVSATKITKYRTTCFQYFDQKFTTFQDHVTWWWSVDCYLQIMDMRNFGRNEWMIRFCLKLSRVNIFHHVDQTLNYSDSSRILLFGN